jgi:hypothetical protein
MGALYHAIVVHAAPPRTPPCDCSGISIRSVDNEQHYCENSQKEDEFVHCVDRRILCKKLFISSFSSTKYVAKNRYLQLDRKYQNKMVRGS